MISSQAGNSCCELASRHGRVVSSQKSDNIAGYFMTRFLAFLLGLALHILQPLSQARVNEKCGNTLHTSKLQGCTLHIHVKLAHSCKSSGPEWGTWGRKRLDIAFERMVFVVILIFCTWVTVWIPKAFMQGSLRNWIVGCARKYIYNLKWGEHRN